VKQKQPPKHPFSLLYVDDDKQNLFLFSTLLNEDYRIFTTTNGRAALDLLGKNEIQVILADQRMPEMNGIQLLEAVSRDFPDIIRILVTGYADIDVVIDAINRGSVYRYISKPWDNDELLATIKNALELYDLKRKNTTLIRSLNAQNTLLQRKLQELRFLNELSIELNELSSFAAIVTRLTTKLQREMGAKTGFFHPLPESNRFNSPPAPVDAAALEIIERLNCEQASPSSERILTAVDPHQSACLLPLAFQDLNFGCLILVFASDALPDQSDLDFAQAAANVASSVLYSLHVHQDRLEKEKFFVLGQTASMIVHDIKGPLTTMLGFIHLLGEDVESGDRRKYTALVRGEITRLLEMVEELLFFSKGKTHLKLEAVDLKLLLNECLNLFSVSFEKEKIDTCIDFAPDCSLYGDYRKLKKALLNILHNARESLKSCPGRRLIAISTACAGGDLEIRISNNGPPVPAEIAAKIFDPFFSYDKDDGTGLGLTICKNIIEEHRGTISIDCTTERTEFIIHLPQIPAAAPIEKNRSHRP
jgi:two-component system NtrC family sensor kinase